MTYGPCWTETTIAGSPTRSSVATDNARRSGILRYELDANPEGVALTTSAAALYGLPVGMEWAVSFRIRGSLTSTEWWSGFSSTAARVSTGTIDFVGVRYASGVDIAYIEGVCRSGTSETTVNLALAAVDSWVAFSMRRTATGVEFYSLDLSDRAIVGRTLVGTVTTNIPTGALLWVAIGGYTTAGASRSCDIDFWTIGGREAR
jgi:hypothetical protein